MLPLRVAVAAGTTESRLVVVALLERGFEVLASQGTDLSMDWPDHPALRLRRGAMDQGEWTAWLEREAPCAVVDAAHPFATALRAILRGVCAASGLDLLRLERAPVALPADAVRVASPDDLVARFFAPGRRILLATGSKTLPFYHAEALERGVSLRARLCPGSVADAALECGFPKERVIWGRGRILSSVWEALLREQGIQVLATKESGVEGGMPEKIEACRNAGAVLAVLTRPDPLEGAFVSVDELVDELERRFL